VRLATSVRRRGARVLAASANVEIDGKEIRDGDGQRRRDVPPRAPSSSPRIASVQNSRADKEAEPKVSGFKEHPSTEAIAVAESNPARTAQRGATTRDQDRS